MSARTKLWPTKAAFGKASTLPSTRLLRLSRSGELSISKIVPDAEGEQQSGDISWHKGRVFVSEVFRNEEIGLEQMDEEVHRVFFCNTELGEFKHLQKCGSCPAVRA